MWILNPPAAVESLGIRFAAEPIGFDCSRPAIPTRTCDSTAAPTTPADSVILVDTSVSRDHFRAADRRLAAWLDDGQVLCHPFAIGELACGNLHRRVEIVSLLTDLPRLPALANEDVIHFVDGHRLMGKGLEWVDRRLADAADRLGVRAA